MLSQAVYENLPASYMVTGSSLIALTQNGLCLYSGCLFFSAGSFVWVLRSSFRRRTKPVPQKRPWFLLPNLIYEFKPFLYILSGFIFFHYASSQSQMVLSLLLVCWGMFRWNQRMKSRQHRIPKEPILIIVPRKEGDDSESER